MEDNNQKINEDNVLFLHDKKSTEANQYFGRISVQDNKQTMDILDLDLLLREEEDGDKNKIYVRILGDIGDVNLQEKKDETFTIEIKHNFGGQRAKIPLIQ